MFLRIIAASCFLACTSWIGSGQAGQDGISMPFEAATGDKFTLLGTRDNRSWIADKPNQHTLETYRYAGEVVSRKPEGYVFRLTLLEYEQKTLLDAKAKPGQKLDRRDPFALAKIGIPMEFETDATGAPTRMVDWDRQRARDEQALRKVYSDWYQQLLGSERPELPAEQIKSAAQRQTDQVVQALFAVLNEQTAALALEEQLLLARVQNRTLPLSTRTSDDRSPQGAAVPGAKLATTYFTLRRHAPEARRAELTWETVFDNTAMAAPMADGRQKGIDAVIPADVPKERREEMKRSVEALWAQTQTEFNESGTATIDLDRGWATQLEVEYKTRTRSKVLPSTDEISRRTLKVIPVSR